MAFPLLALLPLAESIINRFIPDPQAKAQALLELRKEENQQALAELQIEAQTALGQMEINKIEAGSVDKFSSRWRPMIGYICGFAFAYKFVIQPFLIFVLVASGSSFDYHKLPELDWAEMSPVLVGMLGLGGLRTAERITGKIK